MFMKAIATKKRDERGFTMIEGAVVVLVAGVILALATPKILNAMREHRLSMAAREVTDLIQRAKTQALANNQRSSLIVDVAGRQIGLAVYDASGSTITSVNYVPLPEDINFQTPPSVIAPMTGAPTSSAVSFPSYSGSTTAFKQDFTTRGFPSVSSAGAINSVYLGNGRSYRAITLTSVGGLRTWWWEDGAWVAASK
jgi:Tfp pilus assembly protein FimT